MCILICSLKYQDGDIAGYIQHGDKWDELHYVSYRNIAGYIQHCLILLQHHLIILHNLTIVTNDKLITSQQMW